MNYIVNRKLALKYGVREAMVLNKIRAELIARELMNYPRRAGKHWCRMSYKMLSLKLPVLTVSSAGRILRKLVAVGVLQRGIHNDSSFDHTSSYTFTEYGKAVMEDAYGRKS